MKNNYLTLQELSKNTQSMSHMNEDNVINNIEKVLKCDIKETSNFSILTGGYTNPVFTFDYENQTYVYRYPGEGSDAFINRDSEYKAHLIAKELGLDDSLIWIDEHGDKISKYIDDYRYFDYDSEEDVKSIIKIMRDLHSNEKLTGVKYDIFSEINNFYSMNEDYNRKIYPNIEALKDTIFAIYETLDYDRAQLSLCHNDIYTTNILITKKKTYLIDWEFAKDTHPALDLTTFLVCSTYSMEEIEEFLKHYLDENYNQENRILYYKYFSVGAFYWLLWSLHVEANDGDTEGFVQRYYGHLENFLNLLKEENIIN